MTTDKQHQHSRF